VVDEVLLFSTCRTAFVALSFSISTYHYVQFKYIQLPRDI